jgi:sigma-70-like protein
MPPRSASPRAPCTPTCTRPGPNWSPAWPRTTRSARTTEPRHDQHRWPAPGPPGPVRGRFPPPVRRVPRRTAGRRVRRRRRAARFRSWLAERVNHQASDQTSGQKSDNMSDPPSHEASTPSGEPPDADAIRDYLKKVSQVPGLTIEQEAGLAQQIEAGLAAAAKLAAEDDRLAAGERVDLEWIAERGTRARNHLLEANLRLVVSLAKRYTGRGVPFPDLVREGNLGLVSRPGSKGLRPGPPPPGGPPAVPWPAWWRSSWARRPHRSCRCRTRRTRPQRSLRSRPGRTRPYRRRDPH